ncbi:hypothetical protein LC048_06265 [Mesobacillus subterraneus]|uniref:hypothetical protein n=1 Tax=Mesobacillus subterraneus TaxID=285983 RepID=UPI001CFC7DF5|nr:hypothetical protein [Mesobacillus subterraneus]WLR56506.1 hypothetical protein LC048_06265 [Mesobacillus subterraneus]
MSKKTLSDLMGKNFDFEMPKLAPLPTVERQTFDTSHLDEAMEEIALEKEEKEKKEQEYRESVISTLQGIEKNTALLAEMTLLLQKNNEKQDDMFELMVEILAIMKSSNQEEAESKYTEVMKKITTFTDNASTVQSLVNMAQTVFNAYQSMPF